MDVRVSKRVDTEITACRHGEAEFDTDRKNSTEERTSREGENGHSNCEEEGGASAANKGGGYRDNDGAGRENDETQYLDAQHIVTTDHGSQEWSGLLPKQWW